MVDARGLRTISIRLTPEQHKRLKVLAAQKETTIRDLVVEWLERAEKEQAGQEK
ncbi:ribbon-helix-helix protein [Desulfonatronum thiodismutans]|uniref:ribbon-helix-helix protein n=1 Tax=Desulfonatronum thiodismutans TaxID=159290 RepID=UPI001294834C|nr:hypothetical protein [Desulfonatronum thiodismutans]